MQHTVRATKAAEVGARNLANIAHGSAHSGRGELFGVLLMALARAAELREDGFKPQELVNTA